MANHVHETLMTGVLEEGHLRNFRGQHLDGLGEQANEDGKRRFPLYDGYAPRE
jgi:hypothetical protein